MSGGKAQYKCNVALCRYATNDKGALEGHRNREHSRAERVLYNPKRFIDDSEKSYDCRLCDKSFLSKNALRMHHSRTHKAKEYRCEKCGLPFSSKYALQNHTVALHQKKQAGSSSSARHAKQRQVPLKCDRCTIYFNTQPARTAHWNAVHRGEGSSSSALSFRCDISGCPKSFSTAASRVRHKTNEHRGGNGHSCEKCGTSFKYRSSLYRHIRNEHRDVGKKGPKGGINKP